MKKAILLTLVASIFILFSSFVIDKTKTKVNTELSETVLTSGTIYRGGSGTLYNLTPRLTDLTGLSTYYKKPSGKSQAINVAKLQGTALEAVKDGSNHVSIRPKNDSNKVKIKAWAAAKANNGDHAYSRIVKNAID